MQQPMMAAYYPNNVTTDHIQQYLDENKSLILKIVESQNSGKLSECAENQARLQRNLMYLAAIADSQPQPPSMHSQYGSGGMVQAGANFLQPQQAQQMMTQSLMAARSSMMYGQQTLQQQQQQAALYSQLGMGSGVGTSGGLHILQSEAAAHGGGSFGEFDRAAAGLGAAGLKPEMGGSEARGGGSAVDGGESLYLKAGDGEH
ncbi:PREDICTED: GRF1-interacting factor 1-like [Ipomoea nil]|uniref:GRF1-interacting factor 1-like n=1 Tax=Ipomoea nil TaxID=35883 RepID=UPI000901FAFB|nr:PREDICTED: GRF1-interacting factor 1-like [Ipomoea nil]